MRKKKKDEISGIIDIPDNEIGDLLLMAIAHIMTTSMRDKTPDDIIKEFQKARRSVMCD